MIVKRPAFTRAIALLAMFAIALSSTAVSPHQSKATASSSKKAKRKHKHAHHVNMSLVPPPPPSVAIPEGMLLAVPPPAILSVAASNPNQIAFNPYQTAMSTQHPAHRCGHCGFSDSTYLAPTMPNSSPFYRPFPRRTFYNADSMTTLSVSRSRKTRSERLTKRFKKRKCIFANR
ncbi:MAG: hypothetical protein SFY67_08650 [Candidatus Melainabacteria bacterium]|nr:hypothetical protein [Candidatus Melainabacteria bacterium]